MFQPSSHALSALDTNISVTRICRRCLSASALRHPRQQVFRKPQQSADDEPEPPIPGKSKLIRALRVEQAREAEEAYNAKRKQEKRNDVWISVYLSTSEKHSESTYRGMTYDIENALRADNGERDAKGRPYLRDPRYVAPRRLRPYRLCIGLGGFNSAAAARQFLKAWKKPAFSKYLLAPGLEPEAPPVDKHGRPLSYNQREARNFKPRPGHAFFYDNSINYLHFKVAVLQRLCTVPPFSTMPLRVALYSSGATTAWQDALNGDYPGGPNDAVRLPPGESASTLRLATTQLQRRHPLRDGDLAFLAPQVRSPSLPWAGPSGDLVLSGKPSRTLRRTDDMISQIMNRKKLPFRPSMRQAQHIGS